MVKRLHGIEKMCYLHNDKDDHYHLGRVVVKFVVKILALSRLGHPPPFLAHKIHNIHNIVVSKYHASPHVQGLLTKVNACLCVANANLGR